MGTAPRRGAHRRQRAAPSFSRNTQHGLPGTQQAAPRPQRETRRRRASSLYANYDGRHRLAHHFNEREERDATPTNATTAAAAQPPAASKDVDLHPDLEQDVPLETISPTQTTTRASPDTTPVSGRTPLLRARCGSSRHVAFDSDPQDMTLDAAHPEPRRMSLCTPDQADLDDTHAPAPPRAVPTPESEDVIASDDTEDAPLGPPPVPTPASACEDVIAAKPREDDMKDVHVGSPTVSTPGAEVVIDADTRHDAALDVPDSDEQDSGDIADGALTDCSGDEAVLVRSVDNDDRVDLYSSLGDLLAVSDSDDSDDGADGDEHYDSDKVLLRASNTHMRSMRSRIHDIARWDRLLALLTLDGRNAFTEKQFNTLRKALMARDKTLRIPDPRTVKNSLRRALLRHSFPKSDVTFVLDNSEANVFNRSTSIRHGNPPGTSPTDCVRLVLPSQWAKLDVACLPFYNAVYPEDVTTKNSRRLPADVNVEATLAVVDRPLAFLREHLLRAKFEGTHATWHASPADLLSFPCSRPANLRDHDISGWHEWQKDSPAGKSKRYFTQGVLGRTFGVGFEDRDELQSEEMDGATLPTSYVDLEAVVMQECIRPNRAINTDPRSTSVAGSASQTTLPSRPTLIDLELCPGDVLTFIRPTESEITEGICCLLHASPIAASRGRAAERIVWVCLEQTDDRVTAMYTVCSTNVVSMPTFIDSDRKLDEIHNSRLQRGDTNIGTMPNGDRFLVYRVALYGDGFSQNKSSTYSKSVAGVYMLPLGIPPSARTSAQAVRVLCLTPNGMKPEHVMKSIIDDITACARDGVKAVDPFGRSVTVFIDVVQFIGDFPQVAKYTDVAGHSADAMCSLCTVRKRKNRPTPANNFSNDIHSGRIGYTRFDARNRAIRSANAHSEVLRVLGMHTYAKDEVAKLPAVYLSNSLAAVAAEMDGAQHPIPLIFDHALAVPAIPDHLLSIMISSVMAACFKTMDNDHMRGVVEMRIVNAASSNGLDVKHHILTWEKGKDGLKYRGTATNTMSAWLCVLLVSAPIFDELHASQNEPAFLLPRKLQTFASMLYRWPKKEVDGRHDESWDFSNVRHQLRYQHNVTSSAMSFLTTARQVFKDSRAAGAPIDRPMTHRLLELVMNTIPIYGHALMCSELVLEHTHQLFKRWLMQNKHANAHLTGMEKALVRDWTWRMSTLYKMWKRGDNRIKRQAELGLRRVLMGEDGMRVDDSTRNGMSLNEDMTAALENAMISPVPDLLDDCVEMNTSASCSDGYAWTAMWDDHARQFHPLCDGARERIVATRQPRDIQMEDLEYFKRARFMQRDSVGPKRSYRYHVVECGEAISAIVTRDYNPDSTNAVVPTVTDGSGDMCYFVIAGIIGNLRTDKVWVVCKQLIADGPVYSCRESGTTYMLLNSCCRRVGLVHRCSIACMRKAGRAEPKHEEACLDGGFYYVLDRAGGYPPFQG